MNSELQFEWTNVFDKTIAICEDDLNYNTYSAREKMLAFVFTFLQSLNSNEDKYITIIKKNRFPFIQNAVFSELKSNFYVYVDGLILTASNSGEIQIRPFLSNYYKQVIWNAFLSILYFWSNDKSNFKENTDVMVEKTIHFAFDLLAPNAIDSGIDYLQHFIKLRK
ncbi:MAG: hypothetical protein IT275_04005 [Chitinophagales bacterium]|nr:hypothetical protein [Chitinophagales bacterium]